MAWWARTGVGVRVFGALCLVLAAVAYVALEEPLDAPVAFGLAVVGLFALLVLTERAVPAAVAEATNAGSARSLDDVARGLRLAGRATVVPRGANLQDDRLFLAADESAKPLPVLDPDTRLYAAPASVRAGLALDPPGRALADHWEEATGARFADTPVGSLPTALSGLGLSSGTFREARLREEKGRYVLSFRPTGVKPPCFGTRPGEAFPCARTACALCSVSSVALARCLARSVTVADVEVADGAVRLHLETEG